MRVLTFLLLFVSLVLHADIYTQKLYERVLGSIFTHRPIVAYVVGDARKDLEQSHLFRVVSACSDDVNVVIVDAYTSIPKECSYKPVFAITHKAYQKTPQAFGAFYWFKGRPQLHFRSAKMAELGLSLSNELQRYADE